MKSALLGLALLAAVSAPAFAHEGGGMGPHSWPPAAVPQADAPHVTRAQVKAELAQAQKDGTLAADNRVDYPAAHEASRGN